MGGARDADALADAAAVAAPTPEHVQRVLRMGEHLEAGAGPGTPIPSIPLHTHMHMMQGADCVETDVFVTKDLKLVTRWVWMPGHRGL